MGGGPGDETAAVELGYQPAAPASRTKPPPINAIPYDPAPDRERKRGQIAIWLIVLLMALSLVPFVLILVRGVCVAAETNVASVPDGTCSGLPDVALMEVLTLVFTPVVALVGAATGFYFGEKSDESGPPPGQEPRRP